MTGEPDAVTLADDEPLLAAFVGGNWEEHYRASFAVLRAGNADWDALWNRAAFLAPMWLAYRGMWVLQLGAMALFAVLLVFAFAFAGSGAATTGALRAYAGLALVIAYALVGLVEGLTGDRALYKRATAALREVRAQGLDTEAALKAMRRRGGTSVAAAVVLPAAVFAIPLFFSFLMYRNHASPNRAFEATMKSDLRNLVTAQEFYFIEHLTYSAVPPDSFTSRSGFHYPAFRSSQRVTIMIGTVTAHGWNATAKYAGSDLTCAVYVGGAPSPIPDAHEGEPRCR